jgi:NACalpha-BTF3-like transcription factor
MKTYLYPSQWTEQVRIDQVMQATGASEVDAKAYLVAEEGDMKDAIISYKGDRGYHISAS